MNELSILLPVRMVLGTFELFEDVELNGELETELNKLVHRYISGQTLNIKVEPKDGIFIHESYPVNLNLWSIIDSIIQRLHLRTRVFIDERKTIYLTLSQ